MVFVMEDFLHVVIPSMLQNRTDYYVKGGLAYDMYFKDKTHSVDWDVVGTSSFVEYVTIFLTNYTKSLNLKLIVNEGMFGEEKMVQLAFDAQFVEGIDPFFMDIFIVDKKLEFITVNGINYITLMNFVTDLLQTQSNRLDNAERYYRSVREDGPVLKDVADFNRKFGQNIDINDKTVKQVLDETLPFVKNKVQSIAKKDKVRKILQEVVFDQLNGVEDTETIMNILQGSGPKGDPQDKLDDKIPTEEEENEMSAATHFISEEYAGEVLSGVVNLRKNLAEAAPMFGKYKKTRKRFRNVIDISWGNLSDEFKRYLMTHCREKGTDLSLFDISDTCTAYIKCLQPRVVIDKNTGGCVEDESEFEKMDQLLKFN